jgi:hypothetical protein
VARPARGPGRLASRRRGGRRLALPAALLAAGALAAGGAAVAVTGAMGPGDPPPPAAPLETVVTEPPLVVPGPDGALLPARPAGGDDLPGLEGATRAAAAAVGDLRVVAVPGGEQELAAAAEALAERAMRVEPLVVDGREVGLVASTPTDLIGSQPRWALLTVTDRGDERVVLVRGLRDAPERYAADL